MNDLEKRVQVIYCKCGKSIDTAIALDVNWSPQDKAQHTKRINQAKSFGIKTEIITLSEYHKIPFMCNGVKDCIDKIN